MQLDLPFIPVFGPMAYDVARIQDALEFNSSDEDLK